MTTIKMIAELGDVLPNDANPIATGNIVTQTTQRENDAVFASEPVDRCMYLVKVTIPQEKDLKAKSKPRIQAGT